MTPTATTLQRLAAVLGWSDYLTTGSIAVLTPEIIEIRDGVYTYAVAANAVNEWLDGNPPEGEDVYSDDFVHSVPVLDPVSLAREGVDPVSLEGFSGAGGDIEKRFGD